MCGCTGGNPARTAASAEPPCVPKWLRFGRSELSVRFGSNDSETPSSQGVQTMLSLLEELLRPNC